MHRKPSNRSRAAVLARALALLALSAAVFVPSATAAPDRTRPTTPTNLRVTATTTSSVSLAWNASTDNSGSFFYVVTELNSGQTRTIPQAQTAFTWTGLLPSRTYRFRVYAQDLSGNRSFTSNTVSATTPAAPPLTAPANVRQTGATFTSVTVAWDAVGGATSYSVFSNAASWTSATGTTATLNGLAAGTTYSITVRAHGPSGTSPLSTPVNASTLTDATAPTVPTGLTALALSPGVAQLTWNASSDDAGYVNYNVYVDGLPARGMLPDDNVPRKVDIFNLRAGRTYELSLRAYDASGNLSAPAAVMLTMPLGTDTLPPAAPTLQLGGGPAQISRVELGWSWPADNVGVRAFEIYMDGELVAETLFDPHYGGVDTFYTVRQIPPGTTHTFTVKARDEAGNVSGASNPVTVTLLPSSDTEPPSAPTNLTGSTHPNCAFIDFGWGHSTDNVDPWWELDYAIFEDGLFRGYYRGEVHETSFGRHTFHIRAVDRSGNMGPPSNSITLDSGLSC
jgi:chitodextrinase